MRAGFAEVDFTPLQGFMPGEFPAFFASGFYTPLQANAAAFENEGEAVILISADYLLFPNAYATDIRTRIAEQTGVKIENVLLAATHTHMGPALDVPCNKVPAEPEIAQVVALRIVEAGVKAFQAMCDDVELAMTTTEEKRFAFCRDVILKDGTVKTNPGYERDDIVRICEEPDHTLEIMKAEKGSKTVAIMINYANHPDTNGHSRPRNKFCADWPGFMRIALKERYGEDVVVLFFNGCCGDINHHDFINKTDKETYMKPGVVRPEYIGRGMADTIVAAIDKGCTKITDHTVRVENNPLTVKRRQITEGELKWATEVVKRAETDYQNLVEYCTAMRYLANYKDVPETQIFTVTGYRVGPWGMIAMPSEMYTAVGRAIKKGSPFVHTIPVTQANGAFGYVIPDSMRDSGSYEGRFSSGTTGEGALDAIVAGAIDTLKKLY